MADFYVPLATNTLTSIDSLIANAPGAMKVGEAIGNLPDAYWAGQNQAYKQRLQDLFKGGVPRTASGEVDYSKLAAPLIESGGAAEVPSVMPLIRQQMLNDVSRGASLPVQSTSGPPSSATPAQAQQPEQGAATLRQIAQARGLDVDQLARATNLEPDTPLDYGQRQQIGPVLRGAAPPNAEGARIAQTFGDMGAGAAPSGAMAGARPVQTVPVQAGVDDPDRARLQAQFDAAQRRAEFFARQADRKENIEKGAGAADLEQSKQAATLAKGFQDQLLKTDPGNVGFTGATREITKQVDDLGKLADTGIEAKGKIGELNAVQQLGEKVGYGAVPKLQSFLGRYGVDTTGLSDIQAYERAIDFMAPQLRPIGSGRLMQQELTAFKSSLGGLMTTPEGRRISVANLKLINDYSAKVGEIASDTSMTPAQRYNKIYSLDPPKLNLEAPKSAAPAGGGRSGSAVAAPQAGEGQIIINRSTGERRMLRNGQWVPFT